MSVYSSSSSASLVSATLYNIMSSIPDVCDEINRCSYEYESPFKVWLGTKLVLCVTKPEHLELILNHQSTLNKSSMYDEVKLVFGSSLGTAPGTRSN